MLWLLGVLLFVLILMISIGVHEGGHAWAARKLGLNVPRFFIGFGPTLWSFKKGGTEYGVKGIPLGGFVEIFDPTIEDEDDIDRSLLTKVHPVKRIGVFSAGPIVNIVLGVAILVVSLLIMPFAVPTTEIDTVDSCVENTSCGAVKGGMLPGDKVISINGKEVNDIATGLQGVGDGETATIVVERDGEEKTLPVVVTDGKIGVNIKLELGRRTFPQAMESLWDLTSGSTIALAKLPAKIPVVANSIIGKTERPVDSPGSIVAVADVYGNVTSEKIFTPYEKFTQLLFYTGAINLSLGLINLLLPMLPLDGGRIFVSLLDWVRMGWAKLFRKEYKPTGYKTVAAMTYTMGIVIFAMMGILIIADFVAPIPIG